MLSWPTSKQVQACRSSYNIPKKCLQELPGDIRGRDLDLHDTLDDILDPVHVLIRLVDAAPVVAAVAEDDMEALDLLADEAIGKNHQITLQLHYKIMMQNILPDVEFFLITPRHYH